LTGFDRSYSQKLQAEADAKRVNGVVAVAIRLEAKPGKEKEVEQFLLAGPPELPE
jgi:hypothetical protein